MVSYGTAQSSGYKQTRRVELDGGAQLRDLTMGAEAMIQDAAKASSANISQISRLPSMVHDIPTCSATVSDQPQAPVVQDCVVQQIREQVGPWSHWDCPRVGRACIGIVQGIVCPMGLRGP